MQLIGLLVVLVLAGLVMGRMGETFPPQPGPATTPSQTTREVERATGEAAKAERQRLEDAMKALR